MAGCSRVAGARGFTLIEVLVSLLIMAIGMLGLARLQMTTLNNQFEAYQRARALLLTEDLASRIRVNSTRARAGDYPAGTRYGLGAGQNCIATADSVERDLCEWNTALAGAEVRSVGKNLGSIVRARGCLSNPEPSADGEFAIRITVAWLGRAATVSPASSCGRDQYGGDDRFRRTASLDVVLANLAM